MKIPGFLILTLQPLLLMAFAPAQPRSSVSTRSVTMLTAVHRETHTAAINRREWLQQNALTAVFTAASSTLLVGQSAWAATRPPLGDLIYTILRVREATEQETRLIKSGQFKDVQRANIKLAVRFMVENYRLQDAFVSAAAYLDGNDRRIAAGDVGQAAVQNLGKSRE